MHRRYPLCIGTHNDEIEAFHDQTGGEYRRPERRLAIRLERLPSAHLVFLPVGRRGILEDLLVVLNLGSGLQPGPGRLPTPARARAGCQA
jgi:hypothetical protein